MSDASVGSILGYLKLDRSDWDAELNAAGKKADELGAHSPDIKIRTNSAAAIAQLAAVAAASKRLQDAQGAEAVALARLKALQDAGVTSGPKYVAAEQALEKARRAQAVAVIRLAEANSLEAASADKAAAANKRLAASAKEATAPTIGLWSAIAALAPAAVPIAAVAGGALLGLLPIAATVELGVKGIENQMKHGALASSQFGQQVKGLKSELSTLENNAAGGLLSGLSTALSGASPLFQTINQDVSTMSGQLGAIIGHVGPGLLALLTKLNPLFVTFGQLVTHGAAEFEHWAQTSTGISSFVSYVQAELPKVMSFLGELITLLSHVAQGAAPFGGVLLNDLSLFTRALDAIPVNVLRDLIPLLEAAFVAFKAFQGFTYIGQQVQKALDGMAASAAANALQQKAADAEVAASAAQREELVAAARLEEANANLVAARAAVQAIQETGAGDLAATQLIEEDATRQQVAAAERAEAAVTAARTTQAAAEEAAGAIAASGETAAAGWTAMLGPIGAAVAGVGLFSTFLLGNKNAAQQAAAAADSYAGSVQHSTDALNAANVAQTNKNLSDKGALAQLALLQQGTKGLTVTNVDLANAVNGTAQQYDSVKARLEAVAEANRKLYQSGAGSEQDHWGYQKQWIAATKLLSTLGTLRTGLKDEITTQTQLNAANAAAAAPVNQLATAESNYAAAVNRAITAVASLGQLQLAQAQSEDALKTGILNMAAAVKQNGTSLSENTTKGLANRDMLLSLLQQANAVFQAQEKAHPHSAQAVKDYENNITAIEKMATKLGLSKKAVQDLIAQMGLTPTDISTTFKVDTSAAAARLAALKADATSLIDLLNSTATNKRQAGSAGFGVGHNAQGTSYWQGGMTWVGEQGPELLSLPRGSQIMSNARSKQYITNHQTKNVTWSPVINNPLPETAKESEALAMTRAAYLLDND